MTTIVVGMGVVSALSLQFGFSVFIVNMLTSMGLALGIDYSLFVLSRYREERAAGTVKETAIRVAGAPEMASAGRVSTVRTTVVGPAQAAARAAAACKGLEISMIDSLVDRKSDSTVNAGAGSARRAASRRTG